MSDTPYTREEQYLSAIANGSTDVPEPYTREEQYLYEIAKGGGGGGSGLPEVSSADNGKVLKVVNGKWDKANESGGTSYDISVSGTFTQNADNPSATDIGNATFTTSKTLSELIDKVEADGELTIGGCLTQETTLYGQQGYKKCCALKITASAVCDETLTAFLAQAQSRPVDAGTEMIMCRVNNTALNATAPMLIIYSYGGAVQFVVNTQV